MRCPQMLSASAIIWRCAFAGGPLPWLGSRMTHTSAAVVIPAKAGLVAATQAASAASIDSPECPPVVHWLCHQPHVFGSLTGVHVDPPMQLPPWHVSFDVPALPSSQIVPSG